MAVLLNQGLVELTRISQDGMRVRASAGAGSFRRKPTLEKRLAEAQEHLEDLKGNVLRFKMVQNIICFNLIKF